MYSELLAVYHDWPEPDRKALIQLHAVRVFPWLGPTAQAVSKWFAWACLMPAEPAQAILDNFASPTSTHAALRTPEIWGLTTVASCSAWHLQDAFAGPPPLSAWEASLTVPVAESAFDTREGSSDVELLSRAALLMLALAGFGEGMSEWGISDELKRARRREVERVADAVEAVEARIRKQTRRVGECRTWGAAS